MKLLGLAGAWRSKPRIWRQLLVGLTSGAMLVTGLVAIPAATADENDVVLPTTVSADFIPTPQINGVAWDLRVRGNVAYVVGSFTRARPSGVAAGGAGEVVRNNGMAFNIVTGQILSWNPNFNAPVLDIEFSPDGSRFYAGGQFTAVGGQARSKIAEFNSTNGALTSFSTSIGGSVEAMAITNESVFLGGSFNSVGNQTRRNLAKLSRSNAALQSWAPVVDDIVHGVVATDDSDRVIVGGRFQTINGEPKVGVGAVNKETGLQMPWSSTPVPAKINNDQRAWVVDLKLDHGVVYAANNGMGWHWFDGRWAADFETGDLTWLDNCYGSTSSITIMGQVVYSTPHAHDCSSVNGFPEENPMIWKRALAETTFATGTDITAPSNNSLIRNQPIPTLLHWYPSLNTGTYTGQYQGGWAMDNNGDYLVLGGEFTRLNNSNQQGLAVFPKRELSPNALRPEYSTDLKPSVIPQGNGSVRVAWPTTWDQDDEKLTYEVLRDNSLTASDSQVVPSIWWKKTALGFRDTGMQPGSTHTYRIRVSDPWGNSYIGPRSDTVTVTNKAESPYVNALRDAGAHTYYPLNEPSGLMAFDNLGFIDADASAELQRNVEGALSNDSASGFNGQSLISRNMIEAPDEFTTQLWFKTNSNQGGKLIGFGNAKSGQSSSYDRHVWMDDSGRLHFGTWLGWAATVSTSDSFNDGEWHQMTATLGNAGMYLYVDGLRVAERTDVNSGQVYSGAWRIGEDNMNGWPNQPSNTAFNGALDEVAIFESQINAATVLSLYQASGHTADIPEPPADAYGKAVYGDEPQFYWRFDESEGTIAKDNTMAKNDGTIHGSVAYSQGSAIGQGTSLGFGQADATVVSNKPQQNPSVYSAEAWFRTTTENGGKIIGFGNAASGLSSSYDRHVYMRNDGTLVFGVYTGTENTVVTGKSYNDGAWHHLVATQSADGMKLFVDGALTGSNPQSAAEPYTGYWRVGGDRVWGGANSNWFDGDIDEPAIYSRALDQSEINEHFATVGGVNQLPSAEFTKETSGLSATFDASGSTDADGSIVKYAWDFGDGERSDTETVGISHVYTQAGSYTVSLTVTDDRGGSSTITDNVTVKAENALPVAAFTTDQSGLKVLVDGSESVDLDGQIVGFAWDFGDGSAKKQGQQVEHVYAQDGEYTVTLTVTDNEGAESVKNSTVVVANAAPTAALSVTVDGMSISVDGSASSDPEGDELVYAWEFGDGNTASGAKADHEYGQPGEYLVKLNVTDTYGGSAAETTFVTVDVPNTAPIASFESIADGLKVDFSGITSSDADGQVVSWNWEFGDGATGTGENVTHEYRTSGTWPVNLTVVDNRGASATIDGEVTVQDPADLDPTAAFTVSANQLKVELDAAASQPPLAGGEITNYVWDFGDGTTGTGVNATHTYASAGTYSVSLTVSAGDRNNTIAQVVTVAQAQGPSAQFTTSASGRYVQVDASSSVEGDAAITEYDWAFGDGTTGNGKNAEHRYMEDGKYVLSLILTDANGLTSTVSSQIDVKNSKPVAAFNLQIDGLAVVVDGSESSDPDGPVDSYRWDFGDGSTGAGPKASHTYGSGGNFDIKLVVTDADGVASELVQRIQIQETAEPKLLAADAFERTTTNGWESADLGGTWIRGGSAANFAISGGEGRIRMANAGSGPLAWLPVELLDADLRIRISQDKAATGGGIYQTVTIRDIPGVGAYRAKVRILANKSVSVTLERVLGGAVSTLSPETVIGQVTGDPASPVLLRIQSQSTNGTTLRAKAYNEGDPEPVDWQLTASDATAGLQAPGRLGLSVYLSGSANNSPVWAGFDDLEVREIIE